MSTNTRQIWGAIVLVCGLFSCKANLHDAAREMANKKCNLYFANKEYERVHNEYMMFLSQRKVGMNDTSSASMNQERYVELERNMAEHQEKIAQEIQELNEDIMSLDNSYYKRYNDKELASISKDVNALVDKCTH